MNGVIGMASLLLRTDLTEEQLEYAEVMHSSGMSLLTIINSVLDFSKIEAGKTAQEPQSELPGRERRSRCRTRRPGSPRPDHRQPRQ
jgi:signal transduction histidine kinase